MSDLRTPVIHVVRRIRRDSRAVRVLITGGWGTTARRLASLLHSEGNASLILTSRSGRVPAPFKHQCVTFDWFEESTYEGVFGNAYGGVDRVYLVAPPTIEVMTAMKPFIDFCVRRGVARFVFLSGSLFDATTGLYGQVHKYIASLGVDYCVLRPTWFMENLSEHEQLLAIRLENRLYSGAGNGRMAWVSAADIAAVAARALMNPKSFNTDILVLGPELLTYGQVAERLSATLGRKIVHISFPRAKFAEHLVKTGYSRDIAEMFADLDVQISQGADNRTSDAVKNITGRSPKKLGEFINENKSVWLVS